MIQGEKHKKNISIRHLNKSDFVINSQLKIHFVLSGELELVVNGKNKTVRSGEIIILNKGDIISIPMEKNNSILEVVIEESFYHREFNYFQLSQPLSYVYKKDAYEQIAKTLATIYVETLYDRKGSDYIIEGYEKKLYGLLVRYIPVSVTLDDSVPRDASQKNKEVMEYINANYRDNIKLDLLADKFYVNKYYLAHLFKEQLGMTIGNYIREVRLSQSEKDLKNSNRKLMDIAIQNGFPNSKSLTHAFKEKHGVTPSSYRKKENEKSETSVPATDNTEVNLDLINHFIEEDVVALQQSNIKRLEKTVNVNKVVAKNEKREYVVKMKSDNFEKLENLRAVSSTHYVGVSDLLDLIDISYRGNDLSVNYRELDKRINKVLQSGFAPYIQLQVTDYEGWKEKYPYAEDDVFINIIALVKTHLVNTYSTFSDWHVEFRCFYESDQNTSLCVPLSECLSFFKGYTDLVIHFPVFPTGIKEYNLSGNPEVYCINDYTEVKGIDFDRALTSLKKEKYIQVIKEQKNTEYQINLFQRIQEYEKDVYLSRYSGLIQAVISIWNFIRTKQQSSHYISPLSMDTTKPFEYFPIELTKRFSMYTEEGLVTENWYAHKFISELYQDVIFRNEFCIITKNHENYNILILYPEEEVLNYLDRKKEVTSVAFEENRKHPYMQLDLALTGLKGTYKIIQHDLNREVIDQKPEITKIKESKTLSFEDINYYNAVYCPIRNIEEVSIDNDYSLRVNIPILGFSFIQLKKIE